MGGGEESLIRTSLVWILCTPLAGNPEQENGRITNNVTCMITKTLTTCVGTVPSCTNESGLG